MGKVFFMKTNYVVTFVAARFHKQRTRADARKGNWTLNGKKIEPNEMLSSHLKNKAEC